MTWFTWDADDGFVTHPTEEDAKEAAERSLKLWREIATNDGEWPEEVEQLCCGEVTHEVERVSVVYDDTDRSCPGEETCNYKLAAIRGVDIPKTREERLDELLKESMEWLKSYDCGSGDRLVERIREEILKGKGL